MKEADHFSTKVIPYALDDDYPTDLIQVEVDARHDTITGYRTLVKAIYEAEELHGHPRNIMSSYDCTGRPFGSNFKRIDWRRTEVGYTALLTHSYSIDV